VCVCVCVRARERVALPLIPKIIIHKSERFLWENVFNR